MCTLLQLCKKEWGWIPDPTLFHVNCDQHWGKTENTKVASKYSANGLPINIQRTESTSAVFVTVMLIFFILVKVVNL